MVIRAGIRDFPWAVTEHEHGLEEGDHHVLAGALHDHAWKEHHVIGRFGLGIDQGSAERLRLEDDVRISEKQPLTVRLICGGPHRVGLAQPSGRKFVVVDHFQPGITPIRRRSRRVGQSLVS